MRWRLMKAVRVFAGGDAEHVREVVGCAACSFGQTAHAELMVAELVLHEDVRARRATVRPARSCSARPYRALPVRRRHRSHQAACLPRFHRRCRLDPAAIQKAGVDQPVADALRLRVVLQFKVGDLGDARLGLAGEMATYPAAFGIDHRAAERFAAFRRPDPLLQVPGAAGGRLPGLRSALRSGSRNASSQPAG